MIQLTAEAQHMLDEYLRQAELYLRGARTADAEEVTHDLQEHVERELESAPQPVSAAEMAVVLERLGPPEQLVPEEELSWWQQFAQHWRTGPQDWRLAYISLGVLVIGVPLIGTLAVLASFLVARAALDTVPDARELGPQRWLLYPSLILVYISLAFLLLLWPAVPLLILAWHAILPSLLTQTWAYHLPYQDLFQSPAWILLAVPGVLVWWLVLSLLLRRHPTLLPALFRPFVRTSGADLMGRIMLYGFLLLCLLFAARLLVSAQHA